jgi:hypothetical protein
MNEMRIVMFEGRAVKKQHRTADGLSMRVVFYDNTAPPRVVSLEEWRNGATNKYYDDNVRRTDVVRNIANQN